MSSEPSIKKPPSPSPWVSLRDRDREREKYRFKYSVCGLMTKQINTLCYKKKKISSLSKAKEGNNGFWN